MVEQDLGEATIAYEGPDGETVEENVQNEHVAYFQDHWLLRTGEDDEGRDRVRRIPAQRVYYVERTVEEFEKEVETVRDQVQSVADDLRSKLLGGGESGGLGTGGGGESDEPEVYRIDVESGESVTGDDSVADDDPMAGDDSVADDDSRTGDSSVTDADAEGDDPTSDEEP